MGKHRGVSASEKSTSEGILMGHQHSEQYLGVKPVRVRARDLHARTLPRRLIFQGLQLTVRLEKADTNQVR